VEAGLRPLQFRAGDVFARSDRLRWPIGWDRDAPILERTVTRRSRPLTDIDRHRRLVGPRIDYDPVGYRQDQTWRQTEIRRPSGRIEWSQIPGKVLSVR
jgi:hypothetical protein